MHSLLIFPSGREQQTKYLLLIYQLSRSEADVEGATCVNLKYELVKFPVFVINVYFRNVKMCVHIVK